MLPKLTKQQLLRNTFCLAASFRGRAFTTASVGAREINAPNTGTNMSNFRRPKLVKKSKKDLGLPKFRWELFHKEKKLGSGTFGSVYLGRYEGRNEQVVTKKMKSDSVDSKCRFVKEAALLNEVKGHRNIITFFGLSDEPQAIMMEYSCFDYRPFGMEKIVSTLAIFF